MQELLPVLEEWYVEDVYEGCRKTNTPTLTEKHLERKKKKEVQT